MFSKPFSLALVYILSIINFSLLLAPFIAIGLIINYIGEYYISFEIVKPWLFLIIFLISCFMLLYMLADFIFGFHVKGLVRMCHDYRVDSVYEIFGKIFNEVQAKYNQKRVELLIMETATANAFAVGSMRKKYIVLTLGLIKQYYEKSGYDEIKFLSAIKGVIAHEMSHLVNKDFLPGLLMTLNKDITFGISRKFAQFLNFLVLLTRPIPVIGIFTHLFINMFLIIANMAISFYNIFVARIHAFLKAIVSRSIEYRCDRQSAKACGGEAMAYSLSLLPGNSGYSTIFSTHPKTKSRIKKVMKIKQIKGRLGSSLFTDIANALAIFVLIWICAFCGNNAQIPQLISLYYFINNNIINKLKIFFLELTI
jgi:Zn-dependent protease with chaperone function